MSRRVLVLLVTAAACAGCVHAKGSGVRVEPLQADIVFGLAPPAQPAPQPGQTAPHTELTGTPTQSVTVPPGLLPPLPVTVGPTTPNSCPPAALDAFPDQVAGAGITEMPPVGEYKWQIGGITAVGGSLIPVSGFEERLIRRATKIAQAPSDNPDSRDYTFQQLEPYGTKGDVLEITYQVRSDNKGQVHTVVNGVPAQVSAATPDAGMSLLSEDVIGPNGGITALFHPSQPLLLLPLPIVPGASFTSVAADPTTGQVTTLQASVVRRARVDACGTEIDGWEVNGLERTALPPAAGSTTSNPVGGVLSVVSNSASIDNIYATQFGAMPIAEHTLQETALGTVATDDAIGQEKPSPLPAGTA